MDVPDRAAGELMALQWRIEVRVAPPPEEEWVLLRKPGGSPMKFADREKAEETIATIQRVQPQSVLRLTVT